MAPSSWNGVEPLPPPTPPRGGYAFADLFVKVIFSFLLPILWFAPLQAEEKKEDPTALHALIAKTPEEKAKAQSLAASYPLKVCFVSDDKLDDPVDALYGDRLLRFCCKGCVRSFNKNPSKFLPKLDSLEKPTS